MNQYRVSYKAVSADGKEYMHSDDVKAGDLQVEGGCLIFKKTIATNEVVMAYKSWDMVIRVGKTVD